MIRRDLPPPRFVDRVRAEGYRWGGEAVRRSWTALCGFGAIGPDSRAAQGFAAFGSSSIICFPQGALTNERAISIGVGTLIASYVTLSAGWDPDQPDLGPDVLDIGDRCLIGRGSSIVAHRSVRIGHDVWTGPGVYITDMNHGYVDLDVPISQQYQDEAPVTIGDGSWLGTGAVVLPGVSIGRHVVVGAGAVVTHDIADRSVVVGSPARIVRRHDGTAWVDESLRTGNESDAGA